MIFLCIGLMIGLLLGMIMGCSLSYKYVSKNMSQQLTKAESNSDKHLAIMNLFSMWMQNNENGLHIEDYLLENDIKEIAIYGMSFVGERLYDELENSGVKVAYCIDKNVNNLYKDIEIVHPNDSLKNVDAIIVTAFTFFEDIEGELKKKTDAKIISIDDIVYSL